MEHLDSTFKYLQHAGSFQLASIQVKDDVVDVLEKSACDMKDIKELSSRILPILTDVLNILFKAHVVSTKYLSFLSK